MKTRNAFIMLVLALLLLNRTAWATGLENIGVFSDESGTSCSLEDNHSGVVQLYVVQKNVRGALGVEFRVVESDGFTGTLLAASFPSVVTSGNVSSGIAVAYGTCRTGDVVIGTLTYSMQGTSIRCWAGVFARTRMEAACVGWRNKPASRWNSLQ
jgi:hypothetical protein